MMERSNKEAREISEKAGDIFNQVCEVAIRLQKLGGSLGAAVNHYNDTLTSLAGRQGLHGKVERFSQLSSKVSKSLPVLEPLHKDLDHEKLELIIEPLESDEPDDNQQVSAVEAETEK
jgi:DNA recombination protein RmuC